MISASAQFSIEQDLGTDSTFVVQFNSQPCLAFIEKRKCTITSDTVSISSLTATPVSSATNIVAVDANGRLFPVTSTSVSGLQGNRGSATVSGALLQTTYTISHGLSYTPMAVIIQAKSANASALSYVTNITGTSFDVVFLSVPIIGTNNISFNWLAIK